jgi:DNA-binding protein YbaB
MTPDEWLTSFEAKVAEIAQKAAALKETVASAATTESSPDGSVRVSVAANGTLAGLTIHDSAMRRPGTELAEEILALARKAQRAAATSVTEALAPPAEIPQPTPARRRPVDEDDYSHDRIFGEDD